MLRSRIIPCLLIQNGGLVKTQKFQDPKYVGDPINAVRIFNEKQADELIVLDIDASSKGIEPNFEMIAKLASECQMPLCYGGGVSSVDHAVRLIDMGVEKIAVSSAAIARPLLVSELASAVGNQSVVVVLDIAQKSGLFSSGYEIRTCNNKIGHLDDPFYIASEMEQNGAGEILINFVDNDGMMNGYDIALAKKFFDKVKIPVTILGGAGNLEDIQELISSLGVIGAAAGSLFVFKGSYRAVLINYPSYESKIKLCFNDK